MNQNHLVSIVMPSHNASKYIVFAIQSILKQTYTDWELLITDDCSSDDSFKIALELASNDERIKVFKNEKNSGAAITRNNCIKHCSGRFIAFLDSDDLWEPTKLEKQVKFMLENNIDLTYSAYNVLKNEKQIIFTPRHEVTYKSLLKSCDIGCLTAMYDTKRLGKVYMPENAPKREDFAMWLLLLRKGAVAKRTDGVLATYRVHSGSISSNKIKLIKYHWIVYRKVEKLSFFKSLYCLITLTFNKVFFKY